ncbi:hypothetical protein NC652_022538 [Populus alba x Populus x berolinensis]|nr:hypothetical protein NC652_022538 [Populus alba x Populus x berolinensis]
MAAPPPNPINKPRNPKKHSLKDLKTLGHQLLSSRTHINNLPLLLTYISPNFPPQHVLESLLSLHSFFSPLLPDLPSSSRSPTHNKDNDEPDADVIYKTWLRSKFDEFVKSLVDVAVSPKAEDALKEVVLDTLMEFVKTGNGGRFNSAIYHRFLVNIVQSTESLDFVLELLSSKYFKYIDIRYFTYINIEKFAKNLEVKDISDGKTESGDKVGESDSRKSLELSIYKIHYIISNIPLLEDPKQNSDYELWGGSGFSVKKGESKGPSQHLKTEDKDLKSEKHDNDVLSAGNYAKKMKLKFTKAWISFLRLPLPIDVYKEGQTDNFCLYGCFKLAYRMFSDGIDERHLIQSYSDYSPRHAVLGDYVSVDCPIDPDEVRDSERPTKLRLPQPDIDVRSGMTIKESVRDVVVGGGGFIVNDVRFTVNQAVEPVEKGIIKFNEKLHRISQNMKQHNKDKRRTKDDSCIATSSPTRRVIRGIDDPLLNGSFSDTGLARGKKHHRRKSGYISGESGEKVAAIKAMVHIRSGS